MGLSRHFRRRAGEVRSGFLRLFIELAALILVSALVAIFVWWDRGWRKDFLEDESVPEAARVEVLSGLPKVRPPTVAGQFYPAEPDELFDQVAGLLASSPSVGVRGVRAVLVPHAGYVYSGEVAAAGFREVGPAFRRVFLLAANHNGEARFSGVSLPDDTHYAIPGAEVPLSAVVDDLRERALFTRVPAAHTMHMIEVELPFLHQLRGRPEQVDYAIVPMILGQMDTAAVDQLAEILDSYAEPGTVFVFSADLSHYYPDAKARQLDGYTVAAVMSRDRSALAHARTDGNHVLETMLVLAQRRGWEPTLLMTRNSGDVSGDRSRVVGYSAIVFHEPLSLTEREKLALLAFARDSVEERVRNGRVLEPERGWIDSHPIFRIPRGVFVTLEKEGRLRGCIGEIVSRKPLYLGVRDAAISAAVKDTRFQPVRADELDDLSISISVLDYPSRLYVNRPEEYLDLLRPGRDGVVMVHEGRRSTFLPEVWSDVPHPEEFLARLAIKQGAPADAWRSPSTVLYRYGAYVFGEDPALPTTHR